jgi:hypothetical protein
MTTLTTYTNKSDGQLVTKITFENNTYIEVTDYGNSYGYSVSNLGSLDCVYKTKEEVIALIKSQSRLNALPLSKKTAFNLKYWVYAALNDTLLEEEGEVETPTKNINRVWYTEVNGKRYYSNLTEVKNIAKRAGTEVKQETRYV